MFKNLIARLSRKARIEDDPFLYNRTRFSSPLMRRILALNALPLAILSVTLLFLNAFQNSLLETEVAALREQAHIYAAALGQSAVRRRQTQPAIIGNMFAIDPALARPLLIRLTEPSPFVLSRLYGPDGHVIAMSRGAYVCDQRTRQKGCWRKFERVNPASGSARVYDEPSTVQKCCTSLERVYMWLLSFLPLSSHEGIVTLNDHDQNFKNLPGGNGRGDEAPPFIRRTATQDLIITVAKPVVHDGNTIGILQLTRAAPEVDRSLFAVRSSILSLFLAALTVTVFLSWYLSLTIARPLLRLAVASNKLREGPGRVDGMAENILTRRDEIGTLARALRESSKALWAKMDATERFAADVSHELKNPISSIRSAIETLPRVTSDVQRQRLLSIVESDVRRLDRLITDISVASRIDSELSRMQVVPINVGKILLALHEMHNATRRPDDPIIKIADHPTADIRAFAAEERLVQVLRNLISNARSFSPAGGIITLSCRYEGGWVRIIVSDEGPGIPRNKLEEIFERFYSERPRAETFGEHSGLGLSISRQIIEAAHGRIYAENRLREDGEIIGARFIILLPTVRKKVKVRRASRLT